MGLWRLRALVQAGDERSFASGELEYERVPNMGEEQAAPPSKPRDYKLILAFLGLICFGTGNAVFMKLQAIPLYNYPNFTNLFGCVTFVPICFAYILPAYKYGWFKESISQTQWNMSKRPFAIMGALDCMAGMMQVFCNVYLPGPLMVLLPQAAIPISMIFSRHILGDKYKTMQYVGAVVVLLGIGVVLEPEITHRNAADYICEAIQMQQDCSVCQVETTEQACLSHRLDVKPLVDFAQYVLHPDNNDNDEGTAICEWISSTDTASGEQWLVLLWSGVMLLSCIPMCLSTIYKEIVLEDHMDPVFLNGWIVVMQTFYSTILAAPAGMAQSPAVLPKDLPQHIYNGWKCYLGENSIHDGCHPDDCSSAALFFNVGLFMSVFYILTAMFVVKWGSASLLFLGLTIMVPLGNLCFAILPSKAQTTFHVSDIVGLVVILMGLLLYRFSGSPKEAATEPTSNDDISEPVLSSSDDELSEPVPSSSDDISEPLLPSSRPLIEPTPLEQQLREPLLPRVGDV